MATCAECGSPMEHDFSGVTAHLTDDGNIDYDTDADHVAIDETEYGL